MAVTITQKTPSNNSVLIGWNSNPAANVDANAYISTVQTDLGNPPNFPASVLSASADQSGLLPGVTNFTATLNGLSPGTTYYVLCEADGSYSPYPDSFTTTGTVSGPPVPITVQDLAVDIASLSPLTLTFEWDGPDTAQGQVYIGTSPTGLALSGTDLNAGARHFYSINQGLAFNQTYYYQVVSADATGAPVSQGPVMAVATPAAPSNNTYLVTPVPLPGYPHPPIFPFPPPHPPVIPFVTNPHVHPGGRAVITVETRNGSLPASNALVEFKLSDPTMGKLGHGNLIGGDRVQLYSDPHMFETAIFISSGKIGSVTVGIRVVGSTHAHATASATIQVS
jgi:hypothetical protein